MLPVPTKGAAGDLQNLALEPMHRWAISTTDPLTFFSVLGLLLIVTLCACLFPAGRAMRIDPMAALRTE